MNLKYHAMCGVALEYIYPSKGLMLLFSIAPDLTLARNEYIIIKNKMNFNEINVSDIEFNLYMIVHSLFITITLFTINPKIGLAHLIHIICDWFTHTGRFTAMPLFPFKYKFKYGKNTLK